MKKLKCNVWWCDGYFIFKYLKVSSCLVIDVFSIRNNILEVFMTKFEFCLSLTRKEFNPCSCSFAFLNHWNFNFWILWLIIMFCAAVMQSEAFLHLKDSCPTMLMELLEIFASVDHTSSLLLSRKRSVSSIYGQDLTDGGAAESVNPNCKRIRRRT